MTLPNFIVFGTRKAGTTSIYHYLAQHPEVYMSSLKGTRYFMYDPDNPEEGENLPVRSLEQYSSFFAESAREGIAAVGEVSPSYMHSETAARRIQETLPNVKLVASLRNPVDKVYSQFQMDMRRLPKSERIQLTCENAERWYGAGLYFKHLKAYYQRFPRDQIKIYLFEDWIKNPSGMIADLYRFLEIDDTFKPDLDTLYNSGGTPKNEVVGQLLKHRPIYIKLKPLVPKFVRAQANRLRNSNMKKAPPLDPEVRAYISGMFAEDVESLRQLLDNDLDAWRL